MLEKIIIDSDPGQDDAIAILAALAEPSLDVLGITTVAGNVSVQQTSRNALQLCELAGRTDIGVYQGAEGPLAKALVTAEHVHGQSGMDGPDLPPPQTRVRTQQAVPFIIQQLQQAEAGSITLCALGALTNIALALQEAPQIVRKMKRLILMGGGFFEGGNVTPCAEFNFFVDPQAAQMVLDAGLDVTLLPLDVTHQTKVPRAFIHRLRELGTPAARACAELLEEHQKFDMGKFGGEGGPLHDPNVIAYLLQPYIYAGKRVNVVVDTRPGLTNGMSVVDWWGVSGRAANALYVNRVDAAAFFQLLLDRIGRYGNADRR